MFRGWALVRAGERRAGLEHFERGFDRSLRSGTRLGRSMFVAFGVDALLHAEEVARARDRLRLADPDGPPDYASCLLLIARSRLRLIEDDSRGASAEMNRAIEIARVQGAVAFERRASGLRAQLEDG